MEYLIWLAIFGFLAILAMVPVHFHLAAIRKSNAMNGAPSLSNRPTRPCPRCSHPTPRDAAFCESCGVPMMLWKLKTARTVESDQPARKLPIIQQDLCIGCSSCVNACQESVLRIVAGKSSVINPDACTSAGTCIEVCPTGACQPGTGDGASRIVEVPKVDENFETNQAGIYAVGEVGGLALIKNAVTEGHLVIERLLGSHQSRKEFLDLVIVGAGPAGLSAALAAKQAGLRSRIFEQGTFANTIRRFPNRKIVMSEPVRIPMYGTLWISDAPKETLLSVWQTIIHSSGLFINENEPVLMISRQENGTFQVETNQGRYQCLKVILAIGKRGTPRTLSAPGADLPKVFYQLSDAAEYSHSKVLVVGGGDSAAEAAIGLAKQPGTQVVLSYRKTVFSRLRDRNRALVQQLAEGGEIQVLLGTHVEEISQSEVYLSSHSGQDHRLENDYVFAFLGGSSPNTFLEKIGVSIVTKELRMEVQTALPA